MTTPQSVRQIKYIKAKLSAGFCASSGCQNKRGKYYCAECQTKHNARMLKAYYTRKEIERAKAQFAPMVEPIKTEDIAFGKSDV